MTDESLEQDNLNNGGDDGITPQEFAKKIKQKYPQYKDVEDNLLVDKMIKKYPQYKSQINFNVPKKVTPEVKPNGVSQSTSGSGVSSWASYQAPKKTNTVGGVQFQQKNQISDTKLEQARRQSKAPTTKEIGLSDKQIEQNQIDTRPDLESRKVYSQKDFQDAIVKNYEETGDDKPINDFLSSNSAYKGDTLLQTGKGDFLKLPDDSYAKYSDPQTLSQVEKAVPNIQQSGVNVNDFVGYVKEKTNFTEQDKAGVYDNQNEREFELNRLFQEYFNTRANFLINKHNILKNRQTVDGKNRESEIKIVNDELSNLGSGYEDYKRLNLPNIYRKEQNKKSEDKQVYQNIKKGERSLFEDVDQSIENFGMGATFAFADLVSTVADAVGNDYIGDKLRLQKDYYNWANSTNTIPLYEKGKVVSKDGNSYLVTPDGKVIDKDTKTIINSFTDNKELESILDASKESKEEDTVFSGRGATYAMSSSLGNFAFQMLAARGIGKVTGGLPVSGSTRAIASNMMSAGAIMGTNSYNETLSQLKKAGVKDDEAKAQAVKVGTIMSLVSAATNALLPNSAILKSAGGASVKEAVDSAVNTFLREGETGLNKFIQKGIAGVALAAKDGAHESVQEVVENYTQSLLNGNVNNNLNQSILDDNYTQKDMITDAAMAFAVGGIAGGLSGNTKLGAYDTLSILSQDYDKFKNIGEDNVQKGRMTMEEFTDLKDKVEKFKKYNNKIPSTVSSDKVVDLINVLDEKNNLEIQKKNLDKVFHPEIDQKIEGLTNQVNQILNRNEQSETQPTTESQPQEINTETETQQGQTKGEEEININDRIEANNQEIEKLSSTLNKKGKLEGNTFTDEEGKPYTINQYGKNIDEGIMITVQDGDKVIASTMFTPNEDGSISSAATSIQPEYRRKGIGTAMYDYFQEQGFEVQADKDQTNQGKAFSKTYYENRNTENRIKELQKENTELQNKLNETNKQSPEETTTNQETEVTVDQSVQQEESTEPTVTISEDEGTSRVLNSNQERVAINEDAENLKARLSGLKEGYKNGSKDTQKLKKDFIDQVKASIKGLGNYINESDANQILNQVAKVTPNNIDKVSKIIDNLVSRLENRLSKAKINRLKKLQKRANVKARTKYGNAGESIRKLTTLPANQIPEDRLDEYIDLMEQLSKGGDVDFDKVNELYNSLQNDINTFVENKNKEKEERVKEVKDNTEVFNEYSTLKNVSAPEALSDFERKVIRDFKAIPEEYIKGLSVSDISRINKSLETLSTSSYLPNKVLSDIVLKYKAESTASEVINKVGDKILKPTGGIRTFIENLTGNEINSDRFTKVIGKNMLHHIDSAIKGVRGTLFYDNIVHPITSNFNKSDVETNHVANKFTTLFNKAAKKNGFKLNVKLQFYFRQREFESNPELRGKKVFSLADHIKVMEDHKAQLDMPNSDINYISDEFNKVKDQSSEDMFDTFSTEEKAVVEFIDNELRKTEISSRDYNNHLQGETLIYPVNYFPRRNSLVTGNEDIDAEIKNRLTNVLGSTSVKSEASNERTAIKANPLNFDTSGIFMSHIRQSNIEKNLAFPLKETGMTISNLKKSSNESLVSLANSLERTVSNLLEAQLGKNTYSYNSKSEQIFNTFVRNTFTRMLVDPVRLSYDVISNYSTVYTAFADKWGDIYKANKNISRDVNQKIHETISSTQAERLGGSRSSDYKSSMSSSLNQAKNKTLSPTTGQQIVDLYRHNKLSQFSEAAGNLYYEVADKSSQHLWKYYVTEEFKNLTGKEFNGESYLNDKSYREEVQDNLQKAVTSADKKTANYFNTGSSSEQKLSVQLAKGNWFNRLNNFLRSFTFNENRVFWDSLNGLTGFGNTTFDNRPAAFRAFAVINARGIMYSYLGQMVAQYIINFVTEDDKEEEEVINKKAMRRALGQHGMLIFAGNKGALFNFMGNLMFEEVNKQMIKKDGGKYDPYQDNIFFTPNSKSKYVDFLNNLGAEGMAIKSLADSGIMVYNILDKLNTGEKITTEDLVKMKTTQITTSLVSQGTGLPIDRFGRVTQKYLQKVYKTDKKDKKKGKPNSSGYGEYK